VGPTDAHTHTHTHTHTYGPMDVYSVNEFPYSPYWTEKLIHDTNHLY